MRASPKTGVGPGVPTGLALLHDPVFNKGTAFSEAERDALGLRGLLPAHVLTQDQQVLRMRRSLERLPSELDKYMSLAALHDRNEALFFRLLVDYPEQMMPLIYTPTVGLACQQYSQIFQRPRGLFIDARDKGRVADVLRNWPYPASIIVVTDGERILGLGDLGAQGMGIPVGKLALYTACAGVAPHLCLPITLDVGTNNQSLLDDELYIGLRQPRMRGAEYEALLDEFVNAAQEVFPGVLIQFEDFANANAFHLLQKHRERVCCFNDDIQGTAAVALAGLYSALRISNGKLEDQRILFLGAGEAATGICGLVASAMTAKGLTPAQAAGQCWLVDSKGLVVHSRSGLSAEKQHYAHDHPPVADFLSAVEDVRPTAIIGVGAGDARLRGRPVRGRRLRRAAITVEPARGVSTAL